ncbi:MAG: hypothetical protein ACXVQJ_11645 [Actinomycetota bacterium]
MTGRWVRALALAGTLALLAACTSSTTTTVASSSAPVTASPSLTSPTPTGTPTPVVTAHWEVVSGVDAVNPSFTVVALGTCVGPRYDARCRQHLMATQDAGRTWYEMTPPGIPPSFALEHPFFLDPTTGWVVAFACARARARLYRTTDGGRTWGRTDVGDQSCNAGARAVPDFVDPLNGWLTHVEPTGPVADLSRSTDGGKTWRHVGPRFVGSLNDVVFTSTTAGWMNALVNDRGVLERSTDGGRTWTVVTLHRPPSTKGPAYPDVPTTLADGSLVAPVTYSRGSHAVVAFERSTDGGATWSVARTWSGAAPHTNPMWPGVDAAVAGPRVFWILPGASDTVYRSSVEGWSGVRTGAGPLTGITSASPTLAWGLRPVKRANVLVRIGPGGAKVVNPWPPSASPAGNGMTPLASLGRPPAAIAGIAGSLYVATPQGAGTTLERLDPSTGRTRARVQIAHASSFGFGWTSLAVADGALWILMTGAHRTFLARCDTGTLSVQSLQEITRAARGFAPAAAGVWIGTGDRLSLFGASSSTPIRSVRLPGDAALVAASPDGAHVYVTLRGPARDNHDPLLEVDPMSGATLAKVYGGEADLGGYTTLVPTHDGLWIGVATGMMGGLSLLRAGTLAPAAGQIEGTNGIGATYADGRLWVTDAQRSSCNDAQTGRTLAAWGFPDQSGGAVVQAGSEVVTVLGTTLYRIDPSVAC